MRLNCARTNRVNAKIHKIEKKLAIKFSRVCHLLKDKTSRKYDKYHTSGSFALK